jgi:hypothetical protein
MEGKAGEKQGKPEDLPEQVIFQAFGMKGFG